MKAILLAAACLITGEVAAAADPVGTWHCEYEIGGQKRTSTMTIEKNGDRYTGKMSWPDRTEAELRNLTVQGDQLTFSAVRKFQGAEIPVEYRMSIAGDKLDGTGSSDFGGPSQKWRIIGRRGK